MFLQNSAIWSDEDGGGAGGDSGDGVFSSAGGGSDIVRKPILVEVAPVPTPFPPSVSLLVVILFFANPLVGADTYMTSALGGGKQKRR